MVTCKKVKIALIYCKIVFVRCHLMNYISVLELIKRNNLNLRIDFFSSDIVQNLINVFEMSEMMKKIRYITLSVRFQNSIEKW